MPADIPIQTARQIGSIWRRWDLHIHTPSSIVNRYSGTDPWDHFLTNLSNLPPDLSVVGINDYIFVDGYRHVLREYDSGNLPNLEAIFPVVELRMDRFVGTEGHLNRINYHAIFEEHLDPDIIEAHFINGLTAHFKLHDDIDASVTWQGFPSRDALEDLGARIRTSVPTEKRHEFTESDLQLGFNNLVVSIDAIEQRLQDPRFANRAVTAVGKTEWASMPWSDSSIATKKATINGVALVFVAAESEAAYRRARQGLKDAGVNARLLDCSDAHHFSDSEQKDRIGNCFTWINADPTLIGLQNALVEFEQRVFVGHEPPKRAAVRNRPGQHLSAVKIRPTQAHRGDHDFFNVDLELNPGFVAVVGNKGQGKSALLDAIGLVADTPNAEEFSFLHKDRFLNPQRNYADSYEICLNWESDYSRCRRFDEAVPPDTIPLVTYLPQNLIDKICAPSPAPSSDRFSEELESVLFAHVPEPDRLGATNLSELIEKRTRALDHRVGVLREEMSALNEEMARVEQQLSEKRYRKLEAELADLQRQLEALDENEPPAPEKPDEQEDLAEVRSELDTLQARAKGFEEEVGRLEQEDASLAAEVEKLSEVLTDIETLQHQYDGFVQRHSAAVEGLGFDLESIVALRVQRAALDQAEGSRRSRREEIASALNAEEDGSVATRLRTVRAEIEELKERLDEPSRNYERAVQNRAEWQEARRMIEEGAEGTRGIAQVNEELAAFHTLPDYLEGLKDARVDKCKEIHRILSSKVDTLAELYLPARRFIEHHELATRTQLEFAAALKESGLEERLWEIINRRVSGSFMGTDEGSERLRSMIASADFNGTDETVAFAQALDSALHYDQRHDPPRATDPSGLIRGNRAVQEAYDLIWSLSYLQPIYHLQAKGVAIDQLSPGEKGTLLLMFYLLLDPSCRPLLLDQPDENLDNQTIHELLVPAIKEAKRRRQIIVVTHNPNVAVVADADQVIQAAFDGGSFSYTGGAIELPLMNERIVDVLEGTWPAFNTRGLKYQAPPG